MRFDAGELLRAGLLEGVTLVVAARPEATERSSAAAVASAASRLGAAVGELALERAGSAEQEEQEASSAVEELLAQLGCVHALVVDCASLLDARDGREPLLEGMAAIWNAVRLTAQQGFMARGDGGRIILLAPPAGAERAAAAVAGLENLARTLSIEWARHRITAVAIAPAEAMPAEQLAALACFLLSPAGAYFSGCLLDLRGAAQPSGGTVAAA